MEQTENQGGRGPIMRGANRGTHKARKVTRQTRRRRQWIVAVLIPVIIVAIVIAGFVAPPPEAKSE